MSRLLRSATTKPASTRTFFAITGRVQIFLFVGAEVSRQTLHRPDEIDDGIQGGSAAPLAGSALQPFANYI
jgi:hypothetical protein